MNTLRQRIEPLQYRLSILPAARRHQDACLRRVREKARASVVFIVSSLSMWRFQELYEKLRQDTRFSLHFALYPFPSFGLEQRKTSIEEICAYCEEHDKNFRGRCYVSNCSRIFFFTSNHTTNFTIMTWMRLFK